MSQTVPPGSSVNSTVKPRSTDTEGAIEKESILTGAIIGLPVAKLKKIGSMSKKDKMADESPKRRGVFYSPYSGPTF